MRQRAVATVQRNSYVTAQAYHYSVPVQYVNKRVELVCDTDTIRHLSWLYPCGDASPQRYSRMNIQRNRHCLPGRRAASDIAELLSQHRTDRQHRIALSAGCHRGRALSSFTFRVCPPIMKLDKSMDRTACVRMRRGNGRTPLQCQRHGGHT